MICHKCGHENKPGDKFCDKCNAVLDYHELDVDKIDISGLSLEGDDKEKKQVKEKSGSLATKLVMVVVVALVVVGAAVLIPEYLASSKAKVVQEAITSARLGVESYVKENRRWPASEADLVPSIPEQLLAEVSVSINRGVISIGIPEAPGLEATLKPSVKDGRIIWSCENGGIDRKYLPVGCFKQ